MIDDPHLTDRQKNMILRCFFGKVFEKHQRLQRDRLGANIEGLWEWSTHHLCDYFQKQPSAMHLWLCEALDRKSPEHGLKLNLLAPRGAAKSTIGTLAYPLREALERREPYIWIVSDTMSQAHAHLENIKSELTANRRLLERYPEACGKGPIWKGGSIVLRNGIMIEAFGTGQRLRGRRRREHRPSLIVCDDIQSDNHILSAAARDKSRSWFQGTLLKAGNKRTTVLNLATALHNEAIALELFGRPGWVSKRFQAIEHWPLNMSLWEEWESIYSNLENPEARATAREFYESNREKMDEGAVVLWPDQEDLYTLMQMRTESGRTAFEREKQNSPVNPDFCEWPESYFEETIWFEEFPKRRVCCVMSLDPSKGSDSVQGDYSAFVIVVLGEDGLLYVEADLARRSVPEILSQGVELYKKFEPDVFAIESNQFQDLLQSDFALEFAAQGMPQVYPYPLENRTNKLVRIRRLGPLLSSKKLKFRHNSHSTKLLIEQLKMFPVGDHDDGPDALEMAVRVLGEYTREIPRPDGLGNRLRIAT